MISHGELNMTLTFKVNSQGCSAVGFIAIYLVTISKMLKKGRLELFQTQLICALHI